MSSAWKKPFQRLWRKVTSAGKVANSNNKKGSTSSNSRNRKGSNHSSTRASVRSTNTSYSLEDADDDVEKHQQVSPKSSLAGDSVFGENGSLDSLVDEEDHCESVSSDENTFEFFPSHRKDSLILDQILLDIDTERKENGAKTPENNKTEADDEYEDAKAIVGAISVRPNSARSKLDSDSVHLDDASLLDINTETKENDVKTPENNHTEADDEDEDVDAKLIAAISGRPASLLDINTGMEENGVKTPENNHTAADDEHEDVDVKAIVAAISGRPDSANSETDSDSDSSMAVSECSDLDDDSSDEESDHEVFDIEDHINKLAKRENKSDSDNDSDTDGNESVTSGRVSKKTEEIADSDIESTQTSGKGSETDESPISDDTDSEASDQEEDPSASSSRESFEMKRDSVPEMAKNEGAPETAVDHSAKAEVALKENGKTHEDNLAPTLEESRARDLRWPFSNFYVKELKQDLGMPLSDNEEALPSYKSTVAFATHPGRKRNVMLGRVWWVEWWAKEALLKTEYPDETYSL